ncbi:MAG: YrdB family protein [Solirubrobacteraceae bacterium]
MKAANDVVRFLIEVATLIAVGYWGFHEHGSWLAKLVLGIGAPLLIAAVWSVWMAPQSSRRAGEGVRAVLEVVIFGFATAALAASTSAILAIMFGVVAGVNAVLDHTLGRRRDAGP